MNIDKYLYEIIDDYKNANSEEDKAEIFNDFCSSLWSSKNKRRVYTKTIKFKVRSDLLESEIGQVFNTWSEVDYISYKAITKDTDWCSLIRQKINNLYTRYFDSEVILNKDYMDLLTTSKRLYYRWINGEEMNAEELTGIIENSVYNASELKSIYQKQKMNLSWGEYKKVIDGFLKRIFDNCKLIEDYEVENLTNSYINSTNKYIYDFYNEDKSYVKYICDSLEGYMLNYQKKYYGLYVPSSTKQNKQYKHCKDCGSLIENTGNKKTYCKDCAAKRKKKSNSKSDKKYKNKKRENRKLAI